MYNEFDNNDLDREEQSSGGVYSGQRHYNYSNSNDGAVSTAGTENTGYTSNSTTYTSHTTGEENGNTYPYVSRNSGANKDSLNNKKQKKSGFLGKALAIILAAAVFGVATGGTSVYIQNRFFQKSNDISLSDELDYVEEEETKLQADDLDNILEYSEKSDEESVAQTTIVAMDVSDVVEQVMPSVVAISSNYTVTQNFFGQTYSQESSGSGSGIIIGKDENTLYIATNNHVVEDTNGLTVQFIDGSTAEARVKGTDSSIDLAVILVDLGDLDSSTREQISVAKLGNSDSIKVGQAAIAIGNALGYGQSVTVGVISATDRDISISDDTTATGLIQTDAAINPGNSGGALVNIDGEVIGINSSKIGGSTIDGVGFAIPISSAEPILSDIATSESRVKVADSKSGYLGVGGATVTGEVSQMYGMPLGILVRRVYAGTGAEAAGIQMGDVISGIGDKEVGSMEELIEELSYYAAGEVADVTLYRVSGNSYEKINVQVVLTDRATLENASAASN